MTTARRRPLDPNLTWPLGGVGRQYRVAIRNEETGEKRTIYDGTRPSCRLPADFRLSPDQLSYRVESRLADDSYAPFRRHIEFTGIDRVGDDYETPAPDLIVAEPHDRATAYRLVIRDAADRDARFADFLRTEPRFLLPPGRLEGRQAEYAVLPRVDDRWAPGRWRPVTPEMVTAAQARSERLIEVPREPSPRDAANDATAAPGWMRVEQETQSGRRLVVAIDMTLAPLLADAPDTAALAARQWSDGRGGGLIEMVAARLEASGLKGVFFLDVGAAALVGDEVMRAIVRDLEQRGHGVELFHDPDPWRAAAEIDEAETPPAAVRRGMDRFTEIVGRTPRLARLGGTTASTAVISALADAGLSGCVLRPTQIAMLPRWTHGRVRPFAFTDDFAVLPVTTVVSTPAHARDRVVRHEVSAADALISATVQSLVEAEATPRDSLVGPDMLIAHLDPLTLLAVQRTVNPKGAETWNTAVRKQADWARSGWLRGDDGYDFASGASEVALDILDNLFAGLAAAGVPCADPERDFAPGALGRWIDEGRPWDLLIEQRRGSRRPRRSAVRRYDNAFRQALLMRST